MTSSSLTPAIEEALSSLETSEEAKREAWLREHAALYTDTDEIEFLVNRLNQAREALRVVIPLLPAQASERLPAVPGLLLDAGKDVHTQAANTLDFDHSISLRTQAVNHEEAAVGLLNIQMDIQNLLATVTPSVDVAQDLISDSDLQERWYTLITDIADCQSETPSVSAGGLLIRLDWFESLLIEPDFDFALSEDLAPVVRQSIDVIRGDLEQLTGKSTEAMMLIHKIVHREPLQENDWQIVKSWHASDATEKENAGYAGRSGASANWFRRVASR